MNKSRRQFMKMAGGAVTGSLAAATLPPSIAAASSTPTVYSGTDLADWEVVIGDGLWAAPGQSWPDINDIDTFNYGAFSELQANTQQRGVMAHNISFKRIIDNSAFDHIHTLKYKFRIPQVPSTAGGNYNAQTVEGGFFIWDGGNTRLDYGLAFQWILNPWMSTFGDIRFWSDANGGQWQYGGYLQPDTQWHDLEMVFDYQNSSTSMKIDGVVFPSVFGGTPKHASWGTETAARFQAEMISIWPGANATAPMHRAEFKDYEWTWTPYSAQ